MNNGKAVLRDTEAKRFLIEIVGEEGIEVIKALMSGVATDEEIAEETQLKLNIVRKILYKLYDYRLASYVRTKDKEIGWYIYTWKLDLSRVFDIITERKSRMLEDLTRRLEFETSNIFFCCKKDNSKVTFDIASENDFRCPQCRGIMDYVDNKLIVHTLEKEIGKLRREIKHAR